MILSTHTPAPAYSAAHITASAVDYTIDELEDLTSRKITDVPISGDALARIVRLRLGVARATRTADDFYTDVETANDNADYGLWNGSQRPVPTRTNGLDANRRMAAVGRTVEYPMHQLDVRHESRAYPGAVVWSLI